MITVKLDVHYVNHSLEVSELLAVIKQQIDVTNNMHQFQAERARWYFRGFKFILFPRGNPRISVDIIITRRVKPAQ